MKKKTIFEAETKFKKFQNKTNLILSIVNKYCHGKVSFLLSVSLVEPFINNFPSKYQEHLKLAQPLYSLQSPLINYTQLPATVAPTGFSPSTSSINFRANTHGIPRCACCTRAMAMPLYKIYPPPHSPHTPLQSFAFIAMASFQLLCSSCGTEYFERRL